MTFSEFNREFKIHVDNLSYEKRFKLAISICKKLFPDYQDFYNEYNWGNMDIVLDAIILCESKSNLENQSLLREYLIKVDNITPDTEDFENASYALNVCTSVYETIEFILDKDPSHIINIGSCLTDTIDFKIRDDLSLSEQEIDNHPLMVEARNFLMSSIN